jgi:tetratricopeptide (TPR) repeat protein
MDYSALLAYARAIDADPEVGKQVVTGALELADKVGDSRVLGPILAKNVGVATDKETRSQVAYLAAKHNVQNKEFGVAIGMLLMVDKKSEVYSDAEALRGVVLANQGRYNAALAPLLTAQALGETQEKSDRFISAVALNVARAYFGAGNYSRAVEYYAKIDRGSDFWPDAWFEKAWSHFRAQDMNGAVSALMVHDSPFFREVYHPEADLLRSYALFLMCKFKDATAEIDAFNARYEPMKEQLDATLSSYDEIAGWNDGVALVKGQRPQVPGSVIRSFAKDERFLGAVDTVEKAEEELARLQGQSASPFANRAMMTLRSRQTNIKREEGARIKDKATSARDKLGDMLANLKITKLDMMQFETMQLEQAAITGELDTGDRIGQLRKLRTRPDTRMWPWQGEYWADEVGYYNVVSRPDCPDKLRPQGP